MNATKSATKNCKVEGCKRVYRAKGYCNIHFHKWRRGELGKKVRYKICGEENCRKPLFKAGMCEQHYGAWIASRKGGAAIAAAPAETPASTEAPASEPTPAT